MASKEWVEKFDKTPKLSEEDVLEMARTEHPDVASTPTCDLLPSHYT